MNSQRLNLQIFPDAYAALSGVERYLQKCGLEKPLMELVKLRASQINGCAFCVDMHTRDARKGGETEQRLYLVSAWHESPLFTDRERAALAWTECLTRLPTDGAPDNVYTALQAQFSPVEIANLTTLVGMINLWNRIGVGFRLQHPVPAQAAA
jgi:AhpD family alkylhydroperoxidase